MVSHLQMGNGGGNTMRKVGDLFHDTVQYMRMLFTDMYLMEVINGVQVVVCCPMGITFKREVQAAGVAERLTMNHISLIQRLA